MRSNRGRADRMSLPRHRSRGGGADDQRPGRGRKLDVLAWVAAACSAAMLAAVPLGCRETLRAPIPAQHGDDTAPRRGGTLRLASFQDIRTPEPAGASDDHGRVTRELADHWDVDGSGRVYRFALRQGVVMQDGEELTADDVKRSTERALHPTTPDPSASYFEGLVGYAAYAAGKADHLHGVSLE